MGSMTEEERYWYEKRLYQKADAREREIREIFSRRIRGIDLFGNDMPEERKRRDRMRIELECNQAVEFERLTILEPILDAQHKSRLQSLRQQKLERERMERERAERERIEYERAERERQRIEREREEEERRMAPIRAREAEERAKKEAEAERIRREEEEKREQAEKRKDAITSFFLYGSILTVLVAAIIWWRWVVAGIIAIFIIYIFASS